MQSKTTKLRRLLTQSGIKWRDESDFNNYWTSWQDKDGLKWNFLEDRRKAGLADSWTSLCCDHITPEQAIAIAVSTSLQ